MNSHSSNPTESSPNDERINELLADQAVFGLSSDEAHELARLMNNRKRQNDESFDRAAAAIDLSMGKVDPMPETLSQKLREQGLVAMKGSSSESSGELVNESYGSVTPSERPNRVNEIIAWATAIAIGFVALWVWTDARATNGKLNNQLAKLNDRLDSLSKDQTALSEVKERLTAENQALLAQIAPNGEEIYRTLANRGDVIRWDWSAVKDSKGSGDIVWDEESQTGAMRLVNLEVNDPNTSQYQLWIIEANGREHPVDGGVFNVEKDGEVYVPIDAKLFASTPAAFAITKEDPNGVVVSDKNDLPLLAQGPANE